MRVEHIAMYVNDLEKAKVFFVKYFHAKSNDGYHNKSTNFRSYFLAFEDGMSKKFRSLLMKAAFAAD